nr:TPA_asm: m11 iORF RNA 1 [Murid betaherpesvirus 1]DBA07715.1 TPA_asm: m11 iORF RNA 1 [Murid betaherpesvirus 1]
MDRRNKCRLSFCIRG